MKKLFKNEKFQFTMLVLVAISLIAITYSATFLIQNREVFADEIQPPQTLDFNQLLYGTSVGSVVDYGGNLQFNPVSTGFAYTSYETFTIYSGHYYLLLESLGSYLGQAYFEGFDGYTRYGLHNGSIFLCDRNATSNHFFLMVNAHSNTIMGNIMLVDLTQCFGDYAPYVTYDYFKSLFPNFFYKKTLSDVVSFSYINGYNQSLLDIQDSYDVKFGGSELQNNIVSFDYNGVSSGVSISDFAGTSQVFFNGYCSINLPFDLVVGDTFDIKFNAGLSLNGNYLNFGYLNNGVITNINRSSFTNSGASIQGFQWNILTSQTITLNIPVNTNSIIIYLTDSNGNIVPAYSGTGSTSPTRFNLESYSIRTQNLKALFDMQQKSYYNQGLKIGYDNGFRAGLASQNPYTFQALIGAVLDAPVKAITGLLDFDILGVNMKSLYLSLFTLALVLTITKLVMR